MGSSVGYSDIVGASDKVGLKVGLNEVEGGSVGKLVVGAEEGRADGELVGNPVGHKLLFSEMRTDAYAGLALVLMLSTLTVMVLPSIVPLQLPPALSFANKEDSA